MSKLSIITINYNNLEGLKRTVGSVINQTFNLFEYIIIDGGSTDGSAEFIESQSNNFYYWISEQDKGIYNAMNKGIEVATGEYLLFLNSGDNLFDKKVIENNIKYIESYDLIYFNLQTISGDASKMVYYPSKLRFSDLFSGSLPHPATFIKKELFTTTGLYDENFKIVSDWKFFILALFRDNCTYIKINETFSTFYLDGISSRGDYTEEKKTVLNEYFRNHVLDCEELIYNRKFVNTNRFKMLREIEKSKIGMKITSAFFRIYVVLFSKKKLKDILIEKNFFK